MQQMVVVHVSNVTLALLVHLMGWTKHCHVRVDGSQIHWKQHHVKNVPKVITATALHRSLVILVTIVTKEQKLVFLVQEVIHVLEAHPQWNVRKAIMPSTEVILAKFVTRDFIVRTTAPWRRLHALQVMICTSLPHSLH